MTRLHSRYSRETFPADLAMQATPDRAPFSVRFGIRHQARRTNCAAGRKYLAAQPALRDKEARRLVSLTGWALPEVRKRMGLPEAGVGKKEKKTKFFPWW